MKGRLLLDFATPEDSYVLTFEDDGKVAYAYLKLDVDGTIVGDVWLYNRCPTPDLPEWTRRDNIPFANSREFMSEEGRMKRDVGAGDVSVDWKYERGQPVAYVYVFAELLGVVGVGDRPGHARYAVKDGPLARVMEPL